MSNCVKHNQPYIFSVFDECYICRNCEIEFINEVNLLFSAAPRNKENDI